MIRIEPAKIKDVIGSGGKTITQIIDDCNQVKIDIEQDGRVMVMHENTEWIDKAIAKIEAIVREAKVGEIYTATVTRIEKFGVFCQLWEGCEGLCHISKLAKDRVNKCEDVVSIGDQIIVKCINIDEKGRVDLSRKDALTMVDNKEE